MKTHSLIFPLAFCIVCLFGAPAAAATGPAVFGDYMSEFIDYWSKLFGKQSGVVMIALGVGAVALLIISQIKGNKK